MTGLSACAMSYSACVDWREVESSDAWYWRSEIQ